MSGRRINYACGCTIIWDVLRPHPLRCPAHALQAREMGRWWEDEVLLQRLLDEGELSEVGLRAIRDAVPQGSPYQERVR